MKTDFIVNIETEYPLSNAGQLEVLADIRNALQTLKTIYPKIDITVSKVVSNEDIMKAIRSDNQIIDNCLYYDESQGRHKCTNNLVKSSKCRGVCKNYKDKR